MVRLICGILLLAVAAVPAQEPERKRNIAVMDLQAGPGVSEFMINLINEYLGTSVYNSTEYHVISGSSLRDLLKHLGKESLGGCARKSCLGGVGDVLGVEKVIGGNIEKVADGYFIHLMMIRTEGRKMLAYLKEKYTADESQLVTQLDAYIAQLFELEKKNRAQEAREKEERQALMRTIVSESAGTGRRISCAAGVARVVAKNVDPVTASDVIKLRYKHARHHLSFDYIASDITGPDDGLVRGAATDTTVTSETGEFSGVGVSYGFEWLKLLNGWATVIPGFVVGSYAYSYEKNVEPVGSGVASVTKHDSKSSAGGYITVDAGHAFGPVAAEGYYTFKLFYLPDIMGIHEFGGRISYIIGK